MRVKRVVALVVAIMVAFAGLSYTGVTEKEVKAANEWVLEWSDEFDGTSLNAATWNYEIGTGSWGWGNNEHEYYTNRTENVEVSNGTLKIKALKESYKGSEYTSGRITTKNKQTFKYGKVEARIKLPQFTGAWPAFWMLGASGGWPKCGEIDIMEAINTENHTYGYLHWYVESEDYNGQGDTGGSSSGKLPTGYQRTEWHTYGIIWNEESISWYIDDKVFRTASITADHMSEFRQKQYIILNLAIGGEWPGHTIDDTAFPNKSVMEVDYVRVYKPVEEETTPYDGPMVTVTQDAVEDFNGNWTTFFGQGWCGTYGSVTTNGDHKDGYTMNMTSIGDGGNGDAIWSAQCNLENIKYYAGATYKYKCTILSDVDKTIFVKVADSSEESLGGGLVNVQAGVPYEYETTLTIPDDYEGAVSLKFGLAKAQGEDIESNSAATITVSNLSFVTTVTIPDPNYVPPTTETPSTTVAPGTEGTTNSNGEVVGPNGDETTVDPATMKKPRKVTIKKVTKKKLSAKKVSLKVKKVAGATGYELAVYKSKKKASSDEDGAKAIITKDSKRLKLTAKSSMFKNKKKLFVKVRAYVKLKSGTKVYGKWSKIKKVKIK